MVTDAGFIAPWVASAGGYLARLHATAHGFSIQIPRDVDDDDAAVAAQQEDDFEQVGAAVVEQIFPPVANHQFRHQYTDLVVVGLALDRENVIDDRNQYVAVGRRQGDELGNAFAGRAQRTNHNPFPIPADFILFVGYLHVDAANVVGHGQGKREGLLRDAAPAVERNHHDGLRHFGGNNGPVESRFAIHAVVVALHGVHCSDHAGQLENVCSAASSL